MLFHSQNCKKGQKHRREEAKRKKRETRYVLSFFFKGRRNTSQKRKRPIGLFLTVNEHEFVYCYLCWHEWSICNTMKIAHVKSASHIIHDNANCIIIFKKRYKCYLQFRSICSSVRPNLDSLRPKHSSSIHPLREKRFTETRSVRRKMGSSFVRFSILNIINLSTTRFMRF